MSANSRKIKLNLLSVVLCQIITIGIGFLLPRLYIENFGSAVNGVLSTIKQIFTYLCLLEAGIGLATYQALLKPVAQKNHEDINQILAATKHYYIRTGIIYGAAVVLIALFYAFVFQTGLPPYVIIALVLLNGIPSLITFFIQGKYQILLETDGRQYVITNSQIVLQMISGVGKIAVLLLTDSLVLMQTTYCLLAVLQLLYITFYAKRRYRWLDFSVKPNVQAIAQKNSVLVHQISSVVFNNTDILLLSFFCDFTVVSVYSIYNLFFAQVELFISGLVKGFNFALGQCFSVNRKDFIKKYELYEMCYIAANFAVYTLMCLFLLPLIQIYTGGIRDANYFNPTLLFLFVLSKLFSCGKMPSNQVIEYAGKFTETVWHAVAEMLINIGVSIVCILKWGICGALAGTVAAIVFRGTVMIFFTNRKILHRSVMKTYVLWLINGTVFALIFFFYRTTHFSGMSFWPLLWHGVLTALWVVLLYAAANLICRPKQAGQLWYALKERIRHE